MPAAETKKNRHIRLAVICLSAIIAMVVACQHDRQANVLTPIVVPIPGAIPDRGKVIDTSVEHDGVHFPAAPTPEVARARSPEEILAGTQACVTCHIITDHQTMHQREVAGLTCVDCHGGHADVVIPVRITFTDPHFSELKSRAHVRPRLPDLWRSSANPPVPAGLTLQESTDYIRFVNPGDLRAADAACASCHNNASEQFAVNHVHSSMMTHGAMLWEAALYNNGDIARKNAVYADFYDINGKPALATAVPLPTSDQAKSKGWLARLWPIPRWEISQPGNILRVFERGAQRRPIVGIPEPEEDSGRPDVKLSLRGFGTEVRTDPVFLGLQKTRLLDPTLSFFGTNDHAGDYRGSGCTACHVVYANDRSAVHSALWAKYGNRGESFSIDPMVNPSKITEASADPFNPANAARESGHPIKHQFEKAAPTSSCIVCHVHPGTNVVNAYLGFTWWDNETDGQFMYPKTQRYPTPDDEYRVSQSNPEGSAPRGLWSDPAFLNKVGTPEFNSQLKHTQFADFHGHGWIFRAVFKQDRHGNLLDNDGRIVRNVDAEKMRWAIEYQSTKQVPHPIEGLPVHLKDIHLEKGMQCVDCHFKQDAHGDGNLYGETRAAVEVDCVDCHGTVDQPAGIVRYFAAQKAVDDLPRRATKKDKDKAAEAVQLALKSAFTGNAADDPRADARLQMIREHFLPRLSKGKVVGITQKSAIDDKNRWDVVQVNDTITTTSDWYTAAVASPPVRKLHEPQPPPKTTTMEHARLARFAHTVRKNGVTWGAAPGPNDTGELALAHGNGVGNNSMSCYACHSSWNTSCFGCHLPMRANQMKPMLHNEGLVTRNYTNYNYQTLRDDVYMLGVDSTVKGNKIVPVRSACAVMVSSQDANRQWIYAQQQTVSAEGFAGTSFSPYFPHTVRGVETKQCTDCHVSTEGDNNAILAQLLMQGTHAVNFLGRFAWIAKGSGGVEAVAVTERDEPQAVIGSRLHEIAYPDFFKQHIARGKRLVESQEHSGTVLDVQLRGEYLYAACGTGGFIAYDVANIDNKGFSERFNTAPVSPLGQQFYVPTKYATSICSPSTMAIDPTRPHFTENEEQSVHPMYAYLYVTDRDEGLVVIGNPADSPNRPGVSTLLDGNPDNNFLQRALAFNPNGILKGARSMSLLGHYAYICADAGLVVVDINDPLHPRLIPTPRLDNLRHPKKIVFQFRYGFVIDDEGVKVIDVTDPEDPTFPSGRPAIFPLPEARDINLCRTYAYVAAGGRGLVILNVERPTQTDTWDPVEFGAADGSLVDATAVRVGMTNSSLFAYVADGSAGLKVLQLTSPDDTPTFLGFSPRPSPRLIATYPTETPAIALSGGLDRDRAVDESGNQLAVFGRRGARPFTLSEQQRLYLKQDPTDGKNHVYTVTNDPPTAPVALKPSTAKK
jgi:hypothetical protein